MNSHTNATVTISLSKKDLQTLMEEGELSEDGVTITVFE